MAPKRNSSPATATQTQSNPPHPQRFALSSGFNPPQPPRPSPSAPAPAFVFSGEPGAAAPGPLALTKNIPQPTKIYVLAWQTARPSARTTTPDKNPTPTHSDLPCPQACRARQCTGSTSPQPPRLTQSAPAPAQNPQPPVTKTPPQSPARTSTRALPRTARQMPKQFSPSPFIKRGQGGEVFFCQGGKARSSSCHSVSRLRQRPRRSRTGLTKEKTPAALYLPGPRLVSRLRQNPCTPAHGSPNVKTNLPLSIHGEGAGG